VKEARDWSIEGCVEPYVSGKSDGRPVVGYINTIKILELVLNNGVDPLTGKQLGLKTGDLETLNSFDDIMSAYENQMKYFNKLMLNSYNVVGAMHATMMPALISSAVVEDCIKKGLSLQEGGAKYSSSGCFITALANTADSLAAIKTLVFEESKLTLSDLKKVLKNDFKGDENIRQLLLNKAPKYGNDNDMVDGIARKLVGMYVDEIENYRDSRGGKYLLSVLSQSFNVLQGRSVGATPDGRHAFTPLANNASPGAGRDVNGPTASVKSIAKIDQMQTLIGALLNQKYDPAIVKGEKGLDILGGVITAYFDLMGEHIQINVVSKEMLEDAQNNPDNYKNLMVRVAGYSAYFIELDREVQQDIINRTSQSYGLEY
jgi:formate C-acetyltransferase